MIPEPLMPLLCIIGVVLLLMNAITLMIVLTGEPFDGYTIKESAVLCVIWPILLPIVVIKTSIWLIYKTIFE